MPLDRLSTEALRATGISFVAIAVAVSGAALSSDAPQYEIMLWILAVIPAFLLAYHRGWEGVASVLAAVMAGLAAVQAIGAGVGADMAATGPVLRVLLLAIGLTAGVGVMAELLQRASARAEKLELTDAVTGLPNARHAADVLEREFAGAARGRTLTLVAFQIDDITNYQIKHGRKAADEVRRTFASVLRKRTRRMNFSARLESGFVTIFASGDTEAAETFVRLVQADFAAAAGPGNNLSASAGIAAYEPSMAVATALLRSAEFALFQAQQSGRGGVRVGQTREPAREADALVVSIQSLRRRQV